MGSLGWGFAALKFTDAPGHNTMEWVSSFPYMDEKTGMEITH